MSKFKERFKALRTSKGLKQVDIANYLGITPQAVSNYAGGREPDYDTLIAIARLLDVTVDYLIGATDSRNEKTEEFCNLTGLSDEAVDKLISTGEYDHGEHLESNVLSKMICSSEFFDFVDIFSKLIDPYFINITKELLFNSELAYEYVLPEHCIDEKESMDFIRFSLEKQSCDMLIALADSIRQSQKVSKSEIEKALEKLKYDGSDIFW